MGAQTAWAKLDAAGAALPLVDHGADVAVVLARLLGDTAIWAARFQQAAGRTLCDQDRERLSVLAQLHDLGKANRGFWARQFPGARTIGHTNETAALFYSKQWRDHPVSINLQRTIVEWGCEEAFVAVMAHHGRPLTAYVHGSAGEDARKAIEDNQEPAVFWRGADGYNPMAELASLMQGARARFPLAFERGPPLPGAPAFVALLGGMLTLVDWLGSDTALFPIAGPHHEQREPLRQVSAGAAVERRGLLDLATSPTTFEAAFGFSPRGAQAVADRPDLGSVALIEAETGSGKTEAALWRWLALRRAGEVDGLYFALPTRSAAVQLHTRVQAMLNKVFGEDAVEAVLAVPGYLRVGDAQGQALPGFEVVWPDDGGSDARWAAEHPKRFLSARVAVGTIDQALMAGLQLRHAHFRAAMLSRSLLVVDEVHASDAFMGEVLRAVLRNHVALGGQALLLSATLGAEARARLLGHADVAPSRAAAAATPYPAIAGTRLAPTAVGGTGQSGKRVRLEPAPTIDAPEAIAARAVTAARAGASVLIVRNSVATAIAVGQAVEAIAPELAFRVNGVETLHHGRFAPGDRRLLDAAVERGFGRRRDARGRVLVGTQTLEQSLDIDADLLMTDLAPMDVLLQRIGRLHRHDRRDRGAFGEALAVILMPEERDLSYYLGRVRDRHGLGPRGSGEGVYPDLLVLEATLRLIEDNPSISIPADNRRLVEGALHSEVTDALKAELGHRWINHGNQQEGIAIYERQLARDWVFDVTQPFSSLMFPDNDEAIGTRLGTRDRLIAFDPPLPGPFGADAHRLTIPDWMAGDVSMDPVPEVLSENAEGVTFRLGERCYRYGRFGLEAASHG